MDLFAINDKVFQSRLMLGTACYPDSETLRAAIEASGAEIATVAIRRMNCREPSSVLEDLEGCFLLPNTAGCLSAREAVLTAELAREALHTSWIKLEVLADDRTLLPDMEEVLLAADVLVKEGFVVLPYCTDDPVACRKLIDKGCAAVMPLAAPIGSGLGIRNPHNLQLLREAIRAPIIIDAGIGTASDAAIAMELGADAVLMNTAIANARHPVSMAKAMRCAVEAGRLAYLSGRIPKKFYAAASSPHEGRIACAPF